MVRNITQESKSHPSFYFLLNESWIFENEKKKKSSFAEFYLYGRVSDVLALTVTFAFGVHLM